MGGGATAEVQERLFTSTSWTLILDAAGSKSSDQSSQALTQLCTIYWRPVYLFLRRQGYTSHDAQDLTQGFFIGLIEKRFYRNADPDKGRFRSFLLGALKHYLANEKDYHNAQKRGRDIHFVPFSAAAESEMEEIIARSYRFAGEESYEREWAVTLLRRVMVLLEEEWGIAGKRQLFQVLKGYLGAEGSDAVPYEELARTLGRSAVSLRKDVSRLRQRYRAILREEVRQTVDRDDEIDAELRHLRSIMAR